MVVKLCVSPLVNNAEPCVLGRRPVSIEIGRICLVFLPSSLTPSSSILLLVLFYDKDLSIAFLFWIFSASDVYEFKTYSAASFP
jgi:hypothetical protein